MYTREEWAALTPEQRGSCELTTNALNRDGYGKTSARRFGKKIWRVHILAWIDAHGMLPPLETPCVLHHCDNPPCQRVSHLFLGTHRDNSADMAAKGRAYRPPEVPEDVKAEKHRVAVRAWRARNAAAVKAKNAKYYAEYRDEILAHKRQLREVSVG